MKKIKDTTKILAIVCVVAFFMSLCITSTTAYLHMPQSMPATAIMTIPGLPPTPMLGYSYKILWSKTWIDGNYLDTTGGKVATDSNNNIVAFARSAALGSCEHVIVKYSPTGNKIWEKHVNISGIGNIIDVSEYDDDEEENTGACVIADNPYIKLFPCSNNNDDFLFFIQDIQVDSNNNIIFMAELWENTTPVNHEYVVVFKYDSNGNELWKNKYDYSDMLFPEDDLVIDDGNNIYIPCTNYLSTYVLKLTPSGAVDWLKSMGLSFFCLPLSIALDANGDPIIAGLDCLANPYATTNNIEFTKFDHVTGERLLQTEISIPMRGYVVVDAGLVVDKTDNSVFFGYMDRIYKITPSLEYFTKLIPYTYFNFDLKISGEMLIACGGWIDIGGIIKYYSAIYDKNTGAKLLDMPLGPLIYCTDTFFQKYYNHMRQLSIDTNGDVVFSGGEGGLRIVKIHITKGMQPQYFSELLN